MIILIIFNFEIVILGNLGDDESLLRQPCVQLRGSGSNVSTNIMTPVTKSNICCTNCEVDLESERVPALCMWTLSSTLQVYHQHTNHA